MTTIVKGGLLIDGSGSDPLKEPVITIENGKIASVGSSTGGGGAVSGEIIDVSGKTILPGLIDAHVHSTMGYLLQPDAATYDDVGFALLGARNLQTLLAAGITTIRDVGAQNSVIFALKKSIQQKLVRGPRVIASGQIICSTIGHGTELPGSRLSIIADGEENVRKTVREQIAMGADFI